MSGSELKIPKSENSILTFDGANVQRTRDFTADPNATYLVAQFQLKKNHGGWRFYVLDARVKSGPLRNAVVHLRDGTFRNSISDPSLAVYTIPESIKVQAGDVSFEIVALDAK